MKHPGETDSLEQYVNSVSENNKPPSRNAAKTPSTIQKPLEKVYLYVPNNKNNHLQIGASSFLPTFQSSKTANKKFGVVKSFAANTHVGLVRKANEDRIAIILNVI